MSNYYMEPNSHQYGQYPHQYDQYPHQYGQYDQDGMLLNVPPMPIMGKPNNHMVFAIISTVFGFMPLGIIAIVMASKTDTLWAMGDINGAWAASEKARKLSFWSIITPFLLLFIVFVFIIISFMFIGLSM